MFFAWGMLKEIMVLVRKEWALEWRQKFALQGLLLYLASTIFICYMAFKAKTQSLQPITWNALFWIILLFIAVNAIGKSFTQESAARQLFYYQLARPESIIYAKIIYNTGLLVLVAFLGIACYAWVMGNPVGNMGLYLCSLGLGALGFSATLSLIAGIAAQGANANTLMAVLSFPIVLPLILLLIKFSKSAMDGFGWEENLEELAVLLALDLIVLVLSGILFPFIWRH